MFVERVQSGWVGVVSHNNVDASSVTLILDRSCYRALILTTVLHIYIAFPSFAHVAAVVLESRLQRAQCMTLVLSHPIYERKDDRNSEKEGVAGIYCADERIHSVVLIMMMMMDEVLYIFWPKGRRCSIGATEPRKLSQVMMANENCERRRPANQFCSFVPRAGLLQSEAYVFKTLDPLNPHMYGSGSWSHNNDR